MVEWSVKEREREYDDRGLYEGKDGGRVETHKRVEHTQARLTGDRGRGNDIYSQEPCRGYGRGSTRGEDRRNEEVVMLQVCAAGLERCLLQSQALSLARSRAAQPSRPRQLEPVDSRPAARVSACPRHVGRESQA